MKRNHLGMCAIVASCAFLSALAIVSGCGSETGVDDAQDYQTIEEINQEIFGEIGRDYQRQIDDMQRYHEMGGFR